MNNTELLKARVNQILLSNQGTEWAIGAALKRKGCTYIKYNKGFFTIYKVTETKSKITVKVRL